MSRVLDSAVGTVSHHLARYEMVELAILAAVRPPLRLFEVMPRVERFVGMRMTPRRPIVLTTRRLLLPRSYSGEQDWVDVAMDRRQIRVIREWRTGKLIHLELATAFGQQTLSTTSEKDAEAMARALGSPTRR
jgi:hypothetical protein